MLSPNLKPPEAVIFKISQSESFILIWLGWLFSGLRHKAEYSDVIALCLHLR